MTSLEIIANIVNLIAVYLAIRNHPLNWWVGIVGCTLYGWMFFEAKLYADVTLQLFFAATCIKGYWNWRGDGPTSVCSISRLTSRQFIIYFLGALAFTALYGAALARWTDASFPFIDSIVLAFSVLAQFLQVARVLETWIFWLVVNTIAVPLYSAKALYLTSLVYFLFWMGAILGFRNWKRISKGV